MSPNTRGALLIMGSMAGFTANDALIKLAGGSLPLFQIIALRGVLACLWLFLLARWLGALRFSVGRGDLGLLAGRTLSETAATFSFLTALMHMPLANVTAVLQALPLTVTLGAALIFGERVGWRRMLAIAIGFAGMLLIVRPGPEGFGLYSAYALLAVAAVTARDLFTRRMSARVPSVTVSLIASVTITLTAAAVSAFGDWVPLTPASAWLIAGASVFILLGYVFSVMMMRTGEISFVAPFRYSGLLWALLLGWLIFTDWPDPVTLAGAALIVGAGLFNLLREAALRRA